jgi:hypothetical protein
MPIFKNTLVDSNRFDQFAPKYTESWEELVGPINTVKFTVTTDANSIFLLVTNKDTNIRVLDFEIPLGIIKQNPAFADQTLWVIKDSLLEKYTKSNSFDGEYVVERYVLTQQDLLNVAAATFISKDPNIFKEDYNNYYSPIRIFVPSKNSTVDDLTIVFLKEQIPTVGSFVNASESNPAAVETIQTWKNLLATITVTGPTTVSADEVVDLNIACSNTSVTEVFVEPVIGATNKTRIFLDNGQGTLKVNTSGLSSGDTVDIKFGYKYFTGISRYTKTVS